MGNVNERTVKIVVVMVVMLFLMIICFWSGAASTVGGILWLGTPPEDLEVQIHTPEVAVVGDAVLVRVMVTNNSSASFGLHSVDFSTGYLENVNIFTSTPKFDYSEEFESAGIVYRSYYFSHDIGAGESLEIVFKGRAASKGNPAGEIDVCFRGGLACFNNILRTIVR